MYRYKPADLEFLQHGAINQLINVRAKPSQLIIHGDFSPFKYVPIISCNLTSSAIDSCQVADWYFLKGSVAIPPGSNNSDPSLDLP